MKISLGKIYKTRNGRAVRIYDLDNGDNEYPISGSISDSFGRYPYLSNWTPEGFYSIDSTENDEDLIECKPIHTAWINIYGLHRGIAGPYESKEAANIHASHDIRTACIKITYEEGEGL